MITYHAGEDIFRTSAEAIVNPVNCEGYMGKGLALEFKKRFPECYDPYKRACESGILKPGILFYTKTCVMPDLFSYRRPGIILFPTKIQWRKKSSLEWIEAGLYFLKDHYKEWALDRVAMPRLGCGLGGLDWNAVKPLVENALGAADLAVEIFWKEPVQKIGKLRKS